MQRLLAAQAERLIGQRRFQRFFIVAASKGRCEAYLGQMHGARLVDVISSCDGAPVRRPRKLHEPSVDTVKWWLIAQQMRAGNHGPLAMAPDILERALSV